MKEDEKNIDVASRVISLERRIAGLDFLSPVELAQFMTDKDRILNHQKEMKIDIKEIKTSITQLSDMISKERFDNMQKLNELEKDLVGVKTRIAVYTSVGSGLGAIIGWIIGTFPLGK